jgi:hypothetical protein
MISALQRALKISYGKCPKAKAFEGKPVETGF